MKAIVLSLALCVLSSVVFAANPTVVIMTTKGNIELELFEKESPVTVANFLKYVKAKHYDGLIFHRVIKDFMIQGGGFQSGMQQVQPKYAPITNESKNGVPNAFGTIAMARTGDPHSASAQFFINTKDNAFLNGSPNKWGYAVFGKVSKGMDVVMSIQNVPTGNVGRYFQNVPNEEIKIKSIRLKK